eukprot:763604-Prorocentrum_minimum.AAC.1
MRHVAHEDLLEHGKRGSVGGHQGISRGGSSRHLLEHGGALHVLALAVQDAGARVGPGSVVQRLAPPQEGVQKERRRRALRVRVLRVHHAGVDLAPAPKESHIIHQLGVRVYLRHFTTVSALGVPLSSP